MASVMTRTHIHCHVLFATEQHLICRQIHSRLWGSHLAVCTTFNPRLLPPVHFGLWSSASIILLCLLSADFILLTPTGFLVVLPMAVSVTCLPTLKLPTSALLINITRHSIKSFCWNENSVDNTFFGLKKNGYFVKQKIYFQNYITFFRAFQSPPC